MTASFTTWPAPAGETPSPDYRVAVDGRPVFVYAARVRYPVHQKPGLWTHLPGAAAERASFAIFDLAAPVTVAVTPARPFQTARVIPRRAGVRAEVEGGQIRFRLDRPGHVTVVLDEGDQSPLHLFVAAPETNVPRPDDPKVIYFGPGVHQIEGLEVKDGQTVYLAGGAVVKVVLPPGEEGRYSEKWQITFHSGTAIGITGARGVRVAGRGILDAGQLPHPGRAMIVVKDSQDVQLEGIVLRDASAWNVTIAQSRDVRVSDLRIIAGRMNSDGINSVNATGVRVRGCFVRNLDDGIVVKTTQPDPPAHDIRVEGCQVWSDWGYALGVSYETRAPIADLTFQSCDILFGRHWCMGIQVSDSATISDVHFKDITVTDLMPPLDPADARHVLTAEPVLVRLNIAQDCWGQDDQPGRIRGVVVEDVTLDGPRMLRSELSGADAEHEVSGVTLRNIRLFNQPPAGDAQTLKLQTNAHVKDVRIEGSGEG